MALLFSINLPLFLHLLLSKLYHKYIMKCIFVTFPGRRSGCDRACRKVCWFLIRLPRNVTCNAEENAWHTIFYKLVIIKLPVDVIVCVVYWYIGIF